LDGLGGSSHGGLAG